MTIENVTLTQGVPSTGCAQYNIRGSLKKSAAVISQNVDRISGGTV